MDKEEEAEKEEETRASAAEKADEQEQEPEKSYFIGVASFVLMGVGVYLAITDLHPDAHLSIVQLLGSVALLGVGLLLHQNEQLYLKIDTNHDCIVIGMRVFSQAFATIGMIIVPLVVIRYKDESHWLGVIIAVCMFIVSWICDRIRKRMQSESPEQESQPSRGTS